MLLLAVLALLGTNVVSLGLVLVVISWMEVARVVRAEVLVLREQDFCPHAAELLGYGPGRRIFLHLLPRCGRF